MTGARRGVACPLRRHDDVVVIAWLAWIVVLAGCGGSEPRLPAAPAPHPTRAIPRPPAPATGATGPTAVYATPAREVACGESQFQPSAPVDLDGDGRLERIAARREGNEYVVTVHALGSLAEIARHRVRSDGQLEVAIARVPGTTLGDAWLHPGVIEDRAATPPRWRFDMMRVSGPTLTSTWHSGGSARPNVRLDLDGDRHADPLLGDGRVLLGGSLRAMPVPAYPGAVDAAVAGFGMHQPVDLDGDGDLDIVVDGIDGFHVVEVPSLRIVATHAVSGALSSVVRWGDRYLVHAYFTRPPAGGHLFEVRAGARAGSAGAFHEVRRWTDTSRPIPSLDPAGDDSLVAIRRVRSTELVDARSGNSVRTLDVELAGSADPSVGRLGPVRVDDDERPDLVGVRYTELGSFAMGGEGHTRYEIVLIGPGGEGPERVITRHSVDGEGGAGLSLVDIDGDGRWEIVLHESSNYATDDLSGGGGQSRWMLMDGAGRTLWQDEQRGWSFEGDGRRFDAQAEARVLDLAGDGTLALRVRTPTHEWYVLPQRARLPTTLPLCLE